MGKVRKSQPSNDVIFEEKESSLGDLDMDDLEGLDLDPTQTQKT
jgi:hypothetical protein